MRERIGSLASIAWRRLRSRLRPCLAFAALGIVCAEVAELPSWVDQADGRGLGWVFQAMAHDAITIISAAVTVLLILCVFSDDGTAMARRPGKFLFLLVSSSAAATCTGLITHLVIKAESLDTIHIPMDQVFHFWLQALLWGGLVGWLFILNLQRMADRAALDNLLGQRVLLAQQLARTRLGQARAQIDPAMVARILSKVHGLYRSDAANASALLDHLIGYLRLAMNRRPDNTPNAELALIDALVALRQSEHGMTIVVTVVPGTVLSAALFRAVCAELDAALASGARTVGLTLSQRGVESDHMQERETADVAN
jgi:hypothetical protein